MTEETDKIVCFDEHPHSFNLPDTDFKAEVVASGLKEAGYDGNLVAVLGLLKDKDHSKMLENLAPCFEKVFAVTPDSPRAMTAEELEEEAKYHMDAEAAPSVAKAIRLAVDYADENNLAGVVVCGSLYLAAQARPLLLKEAEK